METLRKVLSASAGTQNAPYASMLWPTAGRASPTTGAGQQSEAVDSTWLMTPAWRWSMEVNTKKRFYSLPCCFYNTSLMFYSFFQRRFWWRPSGRVWFLLPCVRSSSSWSHQSTRRLSSVRLNGPIRLLCSPPMDRSRCLEKVSCKTVDYFTVFISCSVFHSGSLMTYAVY